MASYTPAQIAVDLFAKGRPCKFWLTKKQTSWIFGVAQKEAGGVPIGRELHGLHNGLVWTVSLVKRTGTAVIEVRYPPVEDAELPPFTLADVDYPGIWLNGYMEKTGCSFEEAHQAFIKCEDHKNEHWREQTARTRQETA